MGVICLKCAHKSYQAVEVFVKNCGFIHKSLFYVSLSQIHPGIISVFCLDSWQDTLSDEGAGVGLRLSRRCSLTRLHSDIQMLLLLGPNRLTHLSSENWGRAITHKWFLDKSLVLRVIFMKSDFMGKMGFILKTAKLNDQHYLKHQNKTLSSNNCSHCACEPIARQCKCI